MDPNRFWRATGKCVWSSSGNLVLSDVSIYANSNIDILGVKFEKKFTFEGFFSIVSRVSMRIGILRLVNRVFVPISVLLCCYYIFVS